MADKNLHDIKIDDLDNPPKTPLKNILTLLALLFIILVISVVITKLILNTDEENGVENNISTLATTTVESQGDAESTNSETTKESNSDDSSSNSLVPAAAIAAAAATAAVVAVKDDTTKEIKERNVSGSKIKESLRSHVPASSVKELPTPKTVIPKKPTVRKTPVVKDTSHSSPKKHYVDKVVATNNSTKHSTVSHSKEGKQRPGVYIKVGTFKDTNNAIKKIKKTGLNYILIKTKDDKTITRVLIGPFKSNWAADRHLSNVQHNIAKGAYITRIK